MADRADGPSSGRAVASAAQPDPHAAGRDAERTAWFALAARAPQQRLLRAGLAGVRLRRAYPGLPWRRGAGLPRDDRLPARRGRRHGGALEQRERRAVGPAAESARPRAPPADAGLDRRRDRRQPRLSRDRRIFRSGHERDQIVRATRVPSSGFVPNKKKAPFGALFVSRSVFAFL